MLLSHLPYINPAVRLPDPRKNHNTDFFFFPALKTGNGGMVVGSWREVVANDINSGDSERRLGRTPGVRNGERGRG